MDVQPIVKGKKRRKAKPSTDRDVATRLHSKIVRSVGVCEAAGMVGYNDISECLGDLQCAHVIRRRFAATRTDLENGRCLCLRHHTLVDSNPMYMVELVGRDTYERLWLKAQRGVREFSGLTPTMWWRAERERLTGIAKAKGII